jgi:outer membrane protein assembly factor BamB
MSIAGRTASCLVRGAATLSLLLGIGGCGGGMGGTGRPIPIEQRRAALQINNDDYAALGYRLDWRGFPVVTQRQALQFVKAYPDVVLVLEKGSTVTALEANTGAQRWTTQLASPLTKFVGLERQDTRVIACSEAEAYILSVDTGNQIDRQPYASVVDTPPVLAGSMAVFGTGRGELLAHVLNIKGVKGVKGWGNMVTGAISRRPVLMGNAIGAVSESGDVITVDAQSGRLLGKNRIFSSVSGAIASQPAASESVMYVASLDQSIYAFAQNASLLWRRRWGVPLRESPTVIGPSVYCAIDGQGLVAMDAETGVVRWTAKGVDGVVVAVRNNRLLVWDGRTMTTVNPEGGDVYDRVTLPGVAVITFDKFEDGNMYAASNEGVVAKFAPR